ncbi:MAG: YiiX/YebB-like N1pC/P60 family cysteine hydrolase, partial [Pseudomonadota bacterium]
KRLNNAPALLTPSAVKRMHDAASRFEGRPYDLTFEWSNERIYCSELVWKIYDQALNIKIGHLQRIKEFKLSDPAVQAKMRERYGHRIPWEEPAISPVAMFESPLLRTVIEN